MPENNNKIKRNIVDSLFRAMFNQAEVLLEFFKEIYPGEEATLEDVKISDLTTVFVKSMRSDLVFRVKNKFIFLVEAQTDWTENMAIRVFKYLTDEFGAYFRDLPEGTNKLLGHERMEIPTPEAWILYTGERPERIPDEVRLSDSYYRRQTALKLDCIVPVMKDKNHAKVFDAFYIFREHYFDARKRGTEKREAALLACDWCISNGYMVEFFQEHRWEVVDMMCTEEELLAAERTYWTDEIEEAKATSRAEGKAEGRAEGKAEGRAEGKAEGRAEGKAEAILSMHSKGETPERISFLLDMSLEEVEGVIKANG